MITRRFARPHAAIPTRWGVAGAFAAGCVAGGLIVLTMQSRPAPALAAPAPAETRPAITATLPIRGSTHPAEVLRVIDGDTFEARVHVWPGLDITTKVRLRGVDAPELKARCPAERAMAEAARDALRDMLAEGAVGVSAITPDKYGGRVVADAATRSVGSVSVELQSRGLARSYGGGRRRGWCDDAVP
jgi:endonuclease YncB( thermonuclease family)